jgi:hypothetical protein
MIAKEKHPIRILFFRDHEKPGTRPTILDAFANGNQLPFRAQ